MSKKISELESKEEAQLQNEIVATSKPCGVDAYDSSRRIHIDGLGLCGNCVYLQAAKTKYGKAFTVCNEFNTPLRSDDPITECTAFVKSGQMSLVEMTQIAWLVEVDKKDKVGF